jgi:hypothetical protein
MPLERIRTTKAAGGRVGAILLDEESFRIGAEKIFSWDIISSAFNEILTWEEVRTLSVMGLKSGCIRRITQTWEMLI